VITNHKLGTALHLCESGYGTVSHTSLLGLQ